MPPPKPRGRELDALLTKVRGCTLCAARLPLGPRPVVRASVTARLLVAGQAPGRRVHASGIPFDDASGERLRDWLGLSPHVFYDAGRVAILPMGFCYPGTGRSGDLPPRPECAPAWRSSLLALLPELRLTLAIGRYAIAWHWPAAPGGVGEAVQAWRQAPPGLLPLPHPSPRNNGWLRSRPWFESDLLPHVKRRVTATLAERGD